MNISKRSSFQLTESNASHINAEFDALKRHHDLVDSPNNAVHITQEGSLFTVTAKVKSVAAKGSGVITATASGESFNRAVTEAFSKLGKQIQSVKSKHSVREHYTCGVNADSV